VSDSVGTLVVVAVIALLVVLGVSMVSLYAAGRKLRRRGYTPPAIGLMIAACAVLTLALGGVLFVALGSAAAGALTFVSAFMAGTPALFATLAHLLPQRSARAAGARSVRSPSHLLAYAGALLTAAFLAFTLSTPFFVPDVTFDNVLTLALGLAVMTAALIGRGRQFGAQMQAPRTLEAALADDPRAPVLYLREFRQESLPFISSSHADLRPQLKRAYKWIPLVSATFSGATLEEYLTPAIEHRFGPLVALGNPEDYMQPLGAARHYAADQDWQWHFAQLALAARAVVLQLGASDQLAWETGHLLQAGLATKLFVLVGPRALPSRSDPMKRWAWRWQQARWAEFRAGMARAGYRLPEECPPPSVIGFDREGVATVMACQGSLAAERYVELIAAHLDQAGAAQADSAAAAAV
jgi:hypothetical protein